MSGADLQDFNSVYFITDFIATHKLTDFTVLNFSHCQLTLDGLELLCNMAGKLTELETVILSDNNINKNSAVMISKLLNSRGKIKNINLENNEIGDIGLCIIAGGLSTDFSDLSCKLPSVTFLTLSQSKISLISINLSGNNISDIGVISLCNSLKILQKNCMKNNHILPLKKLILDNNKISDNGAYALANILDLGTLKKLILKEKQRSSPERNKFDNNIDNNNILKNASQTTGGVDWGFWTEKSSKLNHYKSQFNAGEIKEYEKNILVKNTEIKNDFIFAPGSLHGVSDENILSSFFPDSTPLILDELSLNDNMIGAAGLFVLLKSLTVPDIDMLKNKFINTLNNTNNDKNNNYHNNNYYKNDNHDINTLNNNYNDKNNNNHDSNDNNSIYSHSILNNKNSNMKKNTNNNSSSINNYCDNEGAIVKKLNIGHNELSLKSIETLTEYLVSIRTKNNDNNSRFHNYEDFRNFEIDFRFTESRGRAIITEIVQSNISSYNNNNNNNNNNNINGYDNNSITSNNNIKNNSRTKNNINNDNKDKINHNSNNEGQVLTKTIEKFVHAIKLNQAIKKIDLGLFPFLLLESSTSFTELNKKAKKEFDDEQNEILKKKDFDFYSQSKDQNIYLIDAPVKNTDFKSPYKFILNDINTSLELLNHISNKLNFSNELSDNIYDHITYMRKRKESEKSLGHFSGISYLSSINDNSNNSNNDNKNNNNNNKNDGNNKNRNNNHNDNYNNNNGVARYGSSSQFDDTINILNEINRNFDNQNNNNNNANSNSNKNSNKSNGSDNNSDNNNNNNNYYFNNNNNNNNDNNDKKNNSFNNNHLNTEFELYSAPMQITNLNILNKRNLENNDDMKSQIKEREERTSERRYRYNSSDNYDNDNSNYDDNNDNNSYDNNNDCNSINTSNSNNKNKNKKRSLSVISLCSRGRSRERIKEYLESVNGNSLPQSPISTQKSNFSNDNHSYPNSNLLKKKEIIDQKYNSKNTNFEKNENMVIFKEKIFDHIDDAIEKKLQKLQEENDRNNDFLSNIDNRELKEMKLEYDKLRSQHKVIFYFIYY